MFKSMFLTIVLVVTESSTINILLYDSTSDVSSSWLLAEIMALLKS